MQRFAGRLIRALHRILERRTGAGDDLRRAATVGRALRYAGTVVVVLVAGMLVLGELGISVTPILATAGVAGIAIGFGAQTLIKDYFTGFFILLEDQIRQGDVVEIAGRAGEVEEVTLRHVRLRDGDGFVHFVPNSEIRLVTNRTRWYAYAMIDAAIAKQQDAEAALAAMREVGEALRKDDKLGSAILEEVQIFGVERWELWGFVVRCRLKVLPSERDSVRREFLRRLAAAFEAKGVATP